MPRFAAEMSFCQNIYIYSRSIANKFNLHDMTGKLELDGFLIKWIIVSRDCDVPIFGANGTLARLVDSINIPNFPRWGFYSNSFRCFRVLGLLDLSILILLD